MLSFTTCSSVIKQLRAVQALEALEAAGLNVIQIFRNIYDEQSFPEIAAQAKILNDTDTESQQISDSQ